MPINFHAKPSKDAKNPSHTLCFDHQGEILLCTYSKPHPGLEAYCKTTGAQLTKLRMQSLQKELTDNDKASLMNIEGTNHNFSRNVPSCVRKTLKYYANCARKYFKVGENPLLILRGQYADWEAWMDNGRRTRVPVKSIWLSKHLNDLK